MRYVDVLNRSECADGPTTHSVLLQEQLTILPLSQKQPHLHSAFKNHHCVTPNSLRRTDAVPTARCSADLAASSCPLTSSRWRTCSAGSPTSAGLTSATDCCSCGPYSDRVSEELRFDSRERREIFSPNCPDRFWAPQNPLVTYNRSYLRGGKSEREVKLTTQSHLAQSLTF